MTFVLIALIGITLVVLAGFVLQLVFALATGHEDIERNSLTVVVPGTATAVLHAAEETLKKNGFTHITRNPEGGVVIGAYRVTRIAPVRFVARDNGDGTCSLTVSGRYKGPVENFAVVVPRELARLNPGLPPQPAVTVPVPLEAVAPVVPMGAPLAPAGWLPDPTGRHQLRYWDSARWTEHVVNDGVTAVDAV